MTNFELVGRSDELAAIPETAGGLNRRNVSECGDRKYDPAKEVVEEFVFHSTKRDARRYENDRFFRVFSYEF